METQDKTYLPFHVHNGIDSPNIDPRNLMGFRVDKVALATIAPSDSPPDGTIRFLYDAVTPTANYITWIRINKTWKKSALS